MIRNPKQQHIVETTQPISSHKLQSQLQSPSLRKPTLYARVICLAACVLVVVMIFPGLLRNASLAQSITLDANGHCLNSTGSIYACWNFQAGAGLGENIGTYTEFLPNLHGWDFRINLPHVRFQRLRTGAGTPVSMVGVIEDPTPLELPAVLPSGETGHRSNSIWLFRIEGSRVFFSQLPSRRDASNRIENTVSLTNGWFRVGDANAPNFQSFRIAAAVVGRGLKASRIHVVAVDNSFGLWHNSISVDRTNITTWTTPWQPLNVTSRSAASVVAIGDTALALAWVDRSNNLQAQVLDQTNNTWSPPVTVARAVDPHSPALVWDGMTLHAIFTSGNLLRHSFRLPENTLAFAQPTTVSSLLPVFEGQFDAIAFNNGIHVVVRTRTGDPVNTGLFYINTKSPSGSSATWTIPSDTGLKAAGVPRIATLYENVFVVAPSPSGSITYARKDPNAVDNRITGGALADRWLDSGLKVDAGTAGPFGNPELLSFNADLYLTANLKPGFVSGSAQIVNFGRAAMKQLLTSKWRMSLLYGGGADSKTSTPFGAGEIRLIGDFDGNRRSDLIRFTQKNISGVGPAPAFVSRVIGNPNVGFTFAADEVWHRFFSLKGEIPLTGDFNGDGRDDIVTFTQVEQRRADGSVIGPAPVWVALSSGTAFQGSAVWHTFFSLKGEIPLVGDFNGDGKKDIITFAQKLQRNADGSVLGQAPVWVALSNGTSFSTSGVWHTFFSLKGEIPMVGDFNGDGKDDIATFVQKPHRDANGNIIAQAPVWVALSDGTRFGQSRIWHNFFSAAGELPGVADLNMDGKDDIVTFLQGMGQGLQARNVYTAFSTGSRFETSTMFATDQVRKGDIPYFGNFTGTTLSAFTQNSNDAMRLLPDLYIFEPNGTIRIAGAMGQIPFQTGAPWERYKWFSEKGVGAALFPEWIYQTGPNHCLSAPFRFILGGAGGSGGAGVMTSSVRTGGRAEHILEEMGHSLFANCMRANADPFGLFKRIYQTPMNAGGLNANNMPGCIGPFDDCRDPEHFFLQLIKRYRLHGDDFRDLINGSPDASIRNRRRAQYLWLKQHWYRGAEFKTGQGLDPITKITDGLLCLPGECSLRSEPAPPPPPPPTRAECLQECRAGLADCRASGERDSVCLRRSRSCVNSCPRQD